MRRSIIFALYGLLAILGYPVHLAFAEMSSENYRVQWESISSGSQGGTSSSYDLRASLQALSGSDLSSSSYRLAQGFRAGIFDPVVTFSVYVQDRSSQVGILSMTDTTIDVTSADEYREGDYIAAVAHEGASQDVSLGKILSIDGDRITVDSFSQGELSLGEGDDVLYRLTSSDSSLPLETPTPRSVSTGIIAWEVFSDTPEGYQVYVFDDGDLRTDDGDVVPDVTDGEVSQGSSEYGARSTDSSLEGSLFDSEDAALGESPALIGSRDGVSFSSRDALTLKVGVSRDQQSGSYGSEVTVLFTGSY